MDCVQNHRHEIVSLPLSLFSFEVLLQSILRFSSLHFTSQVVEFALVEIFELEYWLLLDIPLSETTTTNQFVIDEIAYSQLHNLFVFLVNYLTAIADFTE